MKNKHKKEEKNHHSDAELKETRPGVAKLEESEDEEKIGEESEDSGDPEEEYDFGEENY